MLAALRGPSGAAWLAFLFTITVPPMQRLEFRDGSSSKFWEAGVEGALLTVRFGRIGTAGQTKVKEWASPDGARKEFEKLLREKTGKGYVVAGGDAAPAAVAGTAASPKADPATAVEAGGGARASAPVSFRLLAATPWRFAEDGGAAPLDEAAAWARLQRAVGEEFKSDYVAAGEAGAPGGLRRACAERHDGGSPRAGDKEAWRDALRDPLLRDADEKGLRDYVALCRAAARGCSSHASARAVLSGALGAFLAWVAAARGGAVAARVAQATLRPNRSDGRWHSVAARAFRSALAPLQGAERTAANAALAIRGEVAATEAEAQRIFLMGDAQAARAAGATASGTFVDMFMLESLALAEPRDAREQAMASEALTRFGRVVDFEGTDMTAVAQAFATVLASARRRGLSARPCLEALAPKTCASPHGALRLLTLALFEAGGDDPLACVADHLGDPRIDAALAVVARRDPQRLAAALAPHRARPYVAVKLHELAARGIDVGVAPHAPQAGAGQTHEGVAFAGSPAATQEAAPARDEAAAVAPLLDAAPYPSRLRPGPPITQSEPQAWAELVARLAPILRLSERGQAAACEAPAPDAPDPATLHDKLAKRLKGGQAAAIEALRALRADAGDLAAELARVLSLNSDAPKPKRAAAAQALGLWVVARYGPERAGVILAFVLGVDASPDVAPYEPFYFIGAASFRAVAARLGDDEFEVFRKAALETAAPYPESLVATLFMLGDDRPGGTTLDMVEKAGVEVKRAAFTLAADLGEVDAARADLRGDFLRFEKGDMARHAASIIASCRARRERASPRLRWLKQILIGLYPQQAEWTNWVLALLATREEGVLDVVAADVPARMLALPLDTAEARDPRFLFEEMARLAARGRLPIETKGRFARLAALPDAAAWAKALGPKVEAAVAAQAPAVAAPSVYAPEQDWPAPLRLAPWRAKTQRAPDIALALDPIEAGPAGDGVIANPAIFRVDAAGALREGRLPEAPWRSDPAVALDAESLRLFVELFAKAFEMKSSYYVSRYLDAVHNLPEESALAVIRAKVLPRFYGDSAQTTMEGLAKRFGPLAGDYIAAIVKSYTVFYLPLVRRCAVSALAPLMAPLLFVNKPNQRAAAQAWLMAHPRLAAFRLTPDALGPAGEARKAAEPALRLLAQRAPDAVEEAARAYEAVEPRLREALAQVLERDPLSLCPSFSTPAPGWALDASLPVPRLKDGSGLPPPALALLIDMFVFGDFDEPYVGFEMVREACDRDSLARYVWALFEAWIAAGAPAKGAFALRALGWFGDDAAAREIGRLIKIWPGESAHARATIGLDALAGMGVVQGSEVALMILNAIAEKAPFKGLKDAARRKIDLLAAARGLTAEELADRLAPDFGLDARGGLDLDFGRRRFRVGFDETLKPLVRDADGRVLKDLPKPIKSDDAEKAGEAVKLWAALKKDARALGALQLRRLENMLADQRRVDVAAFRRFFVEHPLTRHLTQRLIWGLYRPDEEAAFATFRVDESDACSDQRDEPFDLPAPGPDAPRVGLAHPLHLDAAARKDWSAVFADYEIIQPFAQIDRPVFRLTEEEKAATTLARVKDVVAPTKRMRGAPNYGWRLGPPQDGGGVGWIEKEMQLRDGDTALAMICLSEGVWMGGADHEPETQALEDVLLRIDGQPVAFGRLTDVGASELLRVLARLVEPT